MKTKILVGAVAAFLFSGAALAHDKDCPPGGKQSMNDQSMSNDRQAVIETQPVDQGIGGSGQVGVDQNLSTSNKSSINEGFGGSGNAGVNNQGMLLRCQPANNNAGTGGSGINQGSSYQSEPLRQPEVTPPAAPVTSEPNGAFAPSTTTTIINEQQPVKKEKGPGLRGLSLTLGGGVEGYSGALAPDINPGPAYGVSAAIRPSKVFGIELGYSGAVNNLDTRAGGVGGSGPDLVRNGGQAALTFGLAATQVQPYVLGGVGLSDYHFRRAAPGFRDDTVGNVPVGAGLRTQFGDFTADLRADYNFLFSQDFAPGVSDGANGNGRYAGTLNIGGTF
jgi:hypothetical protein